MKDTINLFRKSVNTKRSPHNIFFHSLCVICIVPALILTVSCQVKVTKPGENIQRFEDFDPVKVIEKIWETEMIPYYKEGAVDINELLAIAKNDPKEATATYSHRETETVKHNFVVKGTGNVISVSESSAAVAHIDLEPYDNNPDIKVEIGKMLSPVLNSLRDAYDNLSFGDFKNSLEWGALGNSIKSKVKATVVNNVDRAHLIGKTMSFYGAFTCQMDYDFDEIIITPIILDIK